MHLMRFKLFYLIFSTLLIIPGIYYILTGGLKLGIDFTGGSLLEYRFNQTVNQSDLNQYGAVSASGNNTYILRTRPLEQTELDGLKNDLKSRFGDFEVRREEQVGPVIGQELERKALTAVGLACLMIVLYITYSFRRVPKPASSWRFGVSAIVALIHDVLVVLGLFAILGHFFHVEIDTLFVTALLTVIGFSVHDTIVVFDRIRENLQKHAGEKFDGVADISVTQTLGRSLNTSLTVVFTLLALLLFGGETVKWFVVALLVGIVSGTYSSIFNATAVLAWWEERLGH